MPPQSNLIELTNSEEVKFEVFSLEGELLTASVDSTTGKKMVHGVASSTTKDLHGDTILLSALEDMEKSAVGLTVYLNHSYEVPDDVGGTITKAIIRQKGVDQNGDPNYQLEVDIEVEDENDQALKTWRFIQKGRKLGLSIGAMIPAGGARRQKDGTYLIDHLMLLELSMVGIPANPKSWIDYAASALRGMVEKAKTTTLGNPTLTLTGDKYVIEGSLDGVELSLGGEDAVELSIEPKFAADPFDETKTQVALAEAKDGNIVLTVLGAWDFKDEDDRVAAIATIGEDLVSKATVWVETRDGDKITIGEPMEDAANPDVTASAEPDLTDSTTPEPDVTDAKIRIIEVDTDDSQGASSSEPDDADETLAAPEADVTASVEQPIPDDLDPEALLKLSFDQLKAAALIAVRRYEAEKDARIEAERQRDAVVEAAGELVKRTAGIIEKVAAAPLPRKGVLKAVEKEFSTTIEAYYGTEFARALAGK